MKNRYCRRTKLSEDVFLFILAGFCAGLNATTTRNVIEKQGFRVSRQAVEQLFLRLGNYFYYMWARPNFLKLIKEANPTLELRDEVWEFVIFNDVWTNMRGELDYEEYRNNHMPYPGEGILVDVLRLRWKAFNGFQKKTFRAHLGFAHYFIYVELRAPNEEVGYESIKRHLERNPL